jgi:FG-GAP repeat
VWRDQGATTTVVVWYMDGATRTGAAIVTPALYPGVSWQIEAVADYNGDGQPDLVWRDQGVSGAVLIWHMAGVTKSDEVLVTPPPMPGLNWRIVGPR